MAVKQRLKIILLALFIALSCQAQANDLRDLTIVVSSCDKYSALWEPFFASLFKHWPSLTQENISTPIILIANNKTFYNHRVNMVNIPNERSWSDNMLTALKSVKTKYVLVLLDDYWLDQKVDEKRLIELFNGMQNENAAMLQVSANDSRYQTGTKHPTIQGMIYTDKFTHYKASLQAAIWDKQALECILRPGEDPWSFELAGTARSHGYPGVFLSLSANEPLHYINAAQQGYINPLAIKFAQQNNISFDHSKFPVLGTVNYKLTYNKWKKRLDKTISYLKNPGMFYQSGKG